MTKVTFTNRLLLTLLCVILISPTAAPIAALAQENLGQSWKDLSPELRKQKRQQFYSNLPESQKRNLRQNQQKFQALSAQQKRKLCQRFYQQNGYYPPACQSLLQP